MAKSTSAVHDIEGMCSDIGAISSSPDDDKYGWDLHVQFPVPEYLGSPEERPPRKHAYVQIKSTVGKKCSHTIKLSNVQEAVTSSAPWFYLIVMPDKSVRGIHIWGDILTEWMKAVRKAGIEGGPLHKKKLSLNFPVKAKISGNAAQWMLNQIDQIGADYEGEKKRVTEALGYESGYGTGKFVFTNMDKKKMALTFLGLNQNVPVSELTFTKRRFDILDKTPEVIAPAGQITFTPNAIGTCTLKLKGITGEPSLTLVSNVYAFPPPQKTITDGFLRISAPPLEIIRNPTGPFDISLHVEPKRRYPLSMWVNYNKITRWGSVGPIDLKMFSNTGQMHGTINLNKQEHSQLDVMCAAIDGINRIVSLAGAASPSFSEADLAANFKDLLNFATAMQPAMEMFFVADDADVVLPSFQAVIYRVCIRFEHLHISCFVKRDIASETLNAKGKLVITGEPLIEEADVLAVNDNFNPDFLEQEYERYRQRFAEDDTVFDLGDIDTLSNPIPKAP